MATLKRTFSRRQALAGMSTGSAAAIFAAEESNTAIARAQLASPADGYGGAFANNRMTLMALTETAVTQPVLLGEPGREGVFVFDDSDLSAKVSADTAQGLYVAPSSDTTGASGAWVRKYFGPVNFMWFGAVADDATDNLPAFNAMLSILKVNSIQGENANSRGAGMVFIPKGKYYFSSHWELKQCLRIQGEGMGMAGVSAVTLRWPVDTHGIVINTSNTINGGTEASSTGAADGTIIDGVRILSGTTGSTQDSYGIWMRGRASITNCIIEGWSYALVYIKASAGGGGANEGNANGWRIDTLRSGGGGKYGIYVDGADANAGAAYNLDLSSLPTAGIYESSFLGNGYYNVHTAYCGIGDSTAPAQVSHGGNRYYVVYDQHVAASTTEPGTDDTVWRLYGVGGTHSIYPAWVSGNTYQSGAPVVSINANAHNLFSRLYIEGSSPPPYVLKPAMVHQYSIVGALAGDGIYHGTHGSTFRSSAPLRYVTTTAAGKTWDLRLGTTPGAELLLLYNDDINNGFRLKKSGFNIRFDINNSSDILTMTGNLTTDQFGTGAAVPYATWHKNLMVGDTMANGRLMTNGTAAPSTGAHAQGEIVWNRSMAVGSPIGWVCTVAGTPGTWVGIPGQVSASMTTYATPSGGATVDRECRASLAQLAADLTDLKSKLAAQGATA